MNEQQRFKQAFSHLHASENTLQEVLEMTHKHDKKTYSKRSIMILVTTVALLICTSIVAYGSELIFDFFAILTPASDSGSILENIFGNEISTDKPHMEDYKGNPIARPDMERIELDPQAAEEMIGAYISAVEGTFTVDNNIFSMNTFMINDIGIGAFTWTVENSNGIYYKNIGFGMVDFNPLSPFSEPVLTHYIGQTGHFCDTYTYLIKDENNSTKLHLVTYFATAETFTAGDKLTWQVKDHTIQITPINFMSSSTFICDNSMTVNISYQGLALNARSEKEIVPQKILINFTDGSQYILIDDDMNNESGALWRKNGNVNYDELLILFNRLIDPNEIESIEIEYIWRETAEQNGTSESILHTEKCKFVS